MSFTAIFMPVPEGYIGFVEELPGANTQGKTLRPIIADIGLNKEARLDQIKKIVFPISL